MTTVIDLTDRSDTVTLNLSSFFNDDIVFHLPLDAYLVYELLDSNGDVIDTFTDEDDPNEDRENMTPIKVYLEPRLFFWLSFVCSARVNRRVRTRDYGQKTASIVYRKTPQNGLTVSTNDHRRAHGEHKYHSTGCHFHKKKSRAINGQK